jgi:hypothetical protein
VFKIKKDGGKIGELKISKGGVEWKPKGVSVNTISMTWTKFAKIIEA